MKFFLMLTHFPVSALALPATFECFQKNLHLNAGEEDLVPDRATGRIPSLAHPKSILGRDAIHLADLKDFFVANPSLGRDGDV
jgi:hypothetical protein